MKHIKLYENFGNMGMKPFQNSSEVYATCFQGDSYAAVGILNQQETQKLKDAINTYNKEFGDAPEDSVLRLELVDVTGMGYILHDNNGEFTAMPNSTNPDDYAFFITADGNNPNMHSTYKNEEERLFEIPEGKLAVIDHHGHTELLSVDEFLEKYVGY